MAGHWHCKRGAMRLVDQVPHIQRICCTAYSTGTVPVVLRYRYMYRRVNPKFLPVLLLPCHALSAWTFKVDAGCVTITRLITGNIEVFVSKVCTDRKELEPFPGHLTVFTA